MAYVTPAAWVDGSVGGTPVTAAALNLRDANIADHQTRLIALEAGKQSASTLLTRLATAPVVVTYAASISLDASTGCVFRVTATGDLTLADIINGVDGQPVTLEVLASGADRVVTVTGGAVVTVPSGTWWTATFRYNATAAAWLHN